MNYPQPQQPGTPSKEQLIQIVRQTNDQLSDMTEKRRKAIDQLTENFARFKVGDRVLITIRTGDKQVVAKVKKVFWDYFFNDFSYLFKYRENDEKKQVCSANVADIIPL
jgi:hypothetical protein